MEKNKITLVFVLGITLFLSLYLGVGAATAQQEALYLTAIGLAVGGVIAAGKKIWIVIPLVSISSLYFRWIPGNFTITEVGMLATLSGGSLLVTTRRIRLRFNFGFEHFIAALLILMVALTWVRNPVGIALFGGSTLGGRGYFTFAISVLVCLFISGLQVPRAELYLARKAAVVGGLFSMTAQFVGQVPGLSLPMTILFGTSYGGETGQGAADGEVRDEKAADRNIAGATMATVLSRILIGFTSPLKALVRVGWLIVLALSFIGALWAGFRSRLFQICLHYAFAVFYWSGVRGVVISLFIGILGLAALASVNSIVPLPPNVQRTLTFLPGTWEERYKRDAEGSNDWRLEMWEAALFTDYWIDNKYIGDGLGFTLEELDLQRAVANKQIAVRGIGKLSPQQVSFMTNGDYHSGPVSFIRVVGWIGLFIFTIGCFSLAWKAHRLIKSRWRTDDFGLVCFFCIPMVAHPFYFLFIIGDFRKDSVIFLLNLAILTLIRNNLGWSDEEEDEVDTPVGGEVAR
ncbi:hypothetical protein OAK89_01330 [Akkermansiaceae bacterium]|nr:hypothetical protein [Akkermansiaceae bacterium]MDC0286844.1 hypothetical protein [Akkermansiaceae bacterium]